MIPPVHLEKLLAYHRLCVEAEIGYGLGAKPALDLDPDQIHAGDCSWYSRYLLYHATLQQLLIPEGSSNQHEWAERVGLHACRYVNAVRYGGERRLFICFETPETGGGVGHVWLLFAGRTIECHGGKGVDSRAWNAPIEGGRTTLAAVCSACYELPVAA